MKALVIQFQYMGDVLLTSIIANNLKKIYPNIKIDFLCYRRYMGVLQKNPHIDRIIGIEKKRISSLFFFYKYVRLIKSEEYDVLIDLSQNFNSIQVTAFSGAKKKYGYYHPILRLFYDKTLKKVTENITQSCSALENRLVFFEDFLKDNTIPIDPQAKIYLTQEEIEEAREIMSKAGIKFSRPVIMLGIFGSKNYNTWTIGNMAKLIDFIWNYYRADLLLNYMPYQYQQVNTLLSLLNSNTKVFVQPVGKTAREFIGYMNNCNVYIGNYSRAVTIAKALNKPTFTIYAPYTKKEEIACYENNQIHQSAHLNELLPNLYDDFYQNELRKDSPKFYLMLSNEFVIVKVKKFLDQYLSAF